MGYCPQGSKESDMTEHTHTHTHTLLDAVLVQTPCVSRWTVGQISKTSILGLFWLLLQISVLLLWFLCDF